MSKVKKGPSLPILKRVFPKTIPIVEFVTTEKKMTKDELNKEWIKLSQEMQLLESKRKVLYEEYRKEYGAIDLKTYSTPSIYADLNRINILNKEPNRGEITI